MTLELRLEKSFNWRHEILTHEHGHVDYGHVHVETGSRIPPAEPAGISPSCFLSIHVTFYACAPEAEAGMFPFQMRFGIDFMVPPAFSWAEVRSEILCLRIF